MGKFKCKKAFNSIKGNLTAPKASGPTAVRTEHTKVDETEK